MKERGEYLEQVEEKLRIQEEKIQFLEGCFEKEVGKQEILKSLCEENES